MLKNFLIIAWRSMSRQKMYTAINIGGFALGLATCMLIFLFIRHELSHDRAYLHGNRIYRLYNHFTKDGGSWTSMPASVASIVKADYPEVELSARLIPFNWFKAGSNLFRREEQTENTFEEGFAYADQNLLQILEIPMVYGNPLHALDRPNTVVISKSKADKYFPGEDPVGRTIVLNDERKTPYTIGGVMQDFPITSHLHFDFLITLQDVEFWPGEQTSWCCWNYDVYLRLRPGADPRVLEPKFASMRDKHLLGYMKEVGDQSLEDVRKHHHFSLQPIGNIYLGADVNDSLKHGDMRYVWLFGAVACFILALACINFINLSTARSANRAKEVGLRKVVGSMRIHLVKQFLMESVVYSLLSFALALLLVWVALPSFNALAGRTLAMPWTAWWLSPLMFGCALLTGIAAGIYPSFYLSAFKPIDVLKGGISRSGRSAGLRNGLVVFQFTTSLVLIIGTFIIYRQMSYMLHTKIGFSKDQVVMIQGTNTLTDEGLKTLKDEITTLSGVQHVTTGNYLPVAGSHRDQNSFWKEGRNKIDKGVSAQRWFVDPDYLAAMDMKLLQGRNFDKQIASDSQAVIINQAMARELGLQEPLGERIQNWETFTVIGVVEDFHFESMKSKISPLCMTLGSGGSVMAVKTQTADMQSMLQAIQTKWDVVMPNQPFRYTFLDESYAKLYEDVQRMGSVFASFAVLAIIVACLGLFALSSFMVEQRSKEISIRLVLGASFNTILRLLTQSFVRLVLISFVLAAPLAWYLMHRWLDDYSYRIELTWDVFALAGTAALAIALLTISYQSIKAALANPATRLRSE
ncbi:ABC transporter permease [Dawidia soli]|uniref:ABC transporter permease n=1 Tax=Dawidia soli TaxID=2782352 RepID=A0AAP2DBD5_9BACT|nr:ABC transporter permease [Dawidia soli]MBT1687790.1 ABC transporter permease [Dawidia soli]